MGRIDVCLRGAINQAQVNDTRVFLVLLVLFGLGLFAEIDELVVHDMIPMVEHVHSWDQAGGSKALAEASSHHKFISPIKQFS